MSMFENEKNDKNVCLKAETSSCFSVVKMMVKKMSFLSLMHRCAGNNLLLLLLVGVYLVSVVPKLGTRIRKKLIYNVLVSNIFSFFFN